MKAVRFHSYGGSDVLVHEEVDRPVAGAGQVVVEVAGTAFNLLDGAIRGGLVREVFPIGLPHIPNYDAAGVITEGAGRTAQRCWPHPGWAVGVAGRFSVLFLHQQEGVTDAAVDPVAH